MRTLATIVNFARRPMPPPMAAFSTKVTQAGWSAGSGVRTPFSPGTYMGLYARVKLRPDTAVKAKSTFDAATKTIRVQLSVSRGEANSFVAIPMPRGARIGETYRMEIIDPAGQSLKNVARVVTKPAMAPRR